MVYFGRETEHQALIRLFCPPFPVRRQELHTRDCILQATYPMGNQVLRSHDEERNIKLLTYIRPYHAHLDDTGDLARLRVRGHPVGVEEVLRHLQPGRAYTPSHSRFSSAMRL
jgi:hypothetical protein